MEDKNNTPAHHQGEPVADVHVMTIDPHYPGAGRQVYVNWRHGQQEAVKDGAKLYAEQPAPVAVDVLNTGFYTTESGGGKYAINIGFRSMADMQAADAQLRELLKSR